MSRFVDKSATVEVVLANGDTVGVRERLTAKEQAFLNRSLVRMKFDADTGKLQVEEGDWHLQQISILKANIVGWSFTDSKDLPLPYTSNLVDDLDEDTVNELSAAIAKLRQTQAEERTKNGVRP